MRIGQLLLAASILSGPVFGLGSTVLAEDPPVVVTPPAVTPPATPPAVTPPATPELTPDAPTDETMTPPEDGTTEAQDEDLSIGEVPAVEPVELTADMARKALDAYALASDKYKDAELENFENLQDFVDQAPQGKTFEADIKAAGFENVTVWNNTVTTISFAYANQLDDQSAEIRQQIEDIKTDEAMAQDMRDRMVTALSALIPSDNNKKIIEDLTKEPTYVEKLKLLEPEGE